MKKQIPVNHRAIPVFSDRTITVSHVASKPSKNNNKKAERKEGVIRILFVDSVSNTTVADVVMTTIAAEQLIQGINKSIEKVSDDVDNPEITRPPEPEPESVPQQQTYIG